MVIVKQAECDVDVITNLLSQNVPDVSLESNVGELLFLYTDFPNDNASCSWI